MGRCMSVGTEPHVTCVLQSRVPSSCGGSGGRSQPLGEEDWALCTGYQRQPVEVWDSVASLGRGDIGHWWLLDQSQFWDCGLRALMSHRPFRDWLQGPARVGGRKDLEVRQLEGKGQMGPAGREEGRLL